MIIVMEERYAEMAEDILKSWSKGETKISDRIDKKYGHLPLAVRDKILKKCYEILIGDGKI